MKLTKGNEDIKNGGQQEMPTYMFVFGVLQFIKINE